MRKLLVGIVALACVGCMSTLSTPVGAVWSSAKLSPDITDWSVQASADALSLHAGLVTVDFGTHGNESGQWVAYELGPLGGK